MQLLSQPTQIYTVQNYDGSESQTVVTRQCDGTETRSELRTSQTGESQRRDIKINQLNHGKAGMLHVHLLTSLRFKFFVKQTFENKYIFTS